MARGYQRPQGEARGLIAGGVGVRSSRVSAGEWRCLRLSTFVVRLLSDRPADGEVVGEVEHVGAGGHGVINGVSDLVGFAQRAAGAEAADVSSARDGVAQEGGRREPAR